MRLAMKNDYLIDSNEKIVYKFIFPEICMKSSRCNQFIFKYAPFCPNESNMAAVPKAWPTQIVLIGGRMNCIVSAMAKASVSYEYA